MFKTLDDLKKDQKDQKKKGNSYTGGEKSGLAVENPEDKQAIQDILNQASKNSEQMQNDKEKKREINCRIKLYGNGFIIDDGEFRDYSDPKNKQFVMELKQNRVPTELRQKYPNGIQVGLEDRTDEKFVPPPPPKYVQFSGAGISLGGSAQEQQQQQQQQMPVSQAQPKQSNPQQQGSRPKIQIIPQKPASNQLIVYLSLIYRKTDYTKPTTQLLIRLQDGQNITLTVNLSHRVRTIYNHIQNLVSNGSKEIKLITGFPPKQITNLDQTVEEADLMDSQINQS